MVYGHHSCCFSLRMCQDLLTWGHTSIKLPSAYSCYMIKKERFWLFCYIKTPQVGRILHCLRSALAVSHLTLKLCPKEQKQRPNQGWRSGCSTVQTAQLGKVLQQVSHRGAKLALILQPSSNSLQYPNNLSTQTLCKNQKKQLRLKTVFQYNISAGVFAKHFTEFLGPVQKHRVRESLKAKMKPNQSCSTYWWIMFSGSKHFHF